MTSHASKSHTALAELERLQELRDQVATVLQKLDAVTAQEVQRQKLLHAELVKTNAVGFLRKIARQYRTSDTDRKAAETLANQLDEVA